MPRPKKIGGPEPKKRSRTGCWPCKNRKVKCDELRPACENCQKQGDTCDYSIRLNWEGRGYKKAHGTANGSGQMTFSTEPSETRQGKANAKSPETMIESTQNAQSENNLTGVRPGTFHINNEEAQRFEAPIQFMDNNPPHDTISDMVDPALTDGVLHGSTYVNNAPFQPQHQYTQSYERHSSISQGPPTKRPRFEYRQNSTPYDFMMPPPMIIALPNDDSTYSPASVSTPASSNTPLTSSSIQSDDSFRNANLKLPPLTTRDSPRIRRLSVNSLLSGPPGVPNQGATSTNSEGQSWDEQYQDAYQDTQTYGHDRGIKDLDFGKNDDANAISGASPTALRDHLDLVLDDDGQVMPIEFGFGMETDYTTFDKGGYYDMPVPIAIPRALEPLPAKLLENPMNLLYFHHFLNHTAGCLIPHNCSSNPFRSILPQMAVQDDNLLSLLLAYSASHRARLLRQPEPAVRIAMWVRDIFPNLRKALDNPNEIISNANLATAIMLASLEIISPKAFGIAVPWQTHLGTARQIIAARGGPMGMRTASRRDKVSSFLWSWFAYLDVLGSLSGPSKVSAPWIFDYEYDGDDNYHIDCILGFTSRCVRLLAKVAELARVCDGKRIVDSTIRPDWEPSEETKQKAAKLEADLSESRMHPLKGCPHLQSSGEAAYQWDSIEMTATNEAFHWAGLVHLHRRILGKPSTHIDVQNAVREIHGALYKIRKGSAAEGCLLFPMFTAGCDTQDEKQRAELMARLKMVETFGMVQVHKARTLMERAWETGKPWETLVMGEFFG